MYRFNRRPRMLTLGNTPPLSLEQATCEYAKAKAKIAQARHVMIHDAVDAPIELDPAATKRVKREGRREAPTFEDVWTTYAERRLIDTRLSTRKEYDRIIRTYVIPAIGQRKIAEIRARDLKGMLNKVEEDGVAAVFNFASSQFIIARSWRTGYTYRD